MHPIVVAILSVGQIIVIAHPIVIVIVRVRIWARVSDAFQLGFGLG